MAEVGFDDNGVARKNLTPNAWWQWLLTGKLEVREKKAYLVTWFGETELGRVGSVPTKAMLEENKLKIFNLANAGVEIELEGYRWSAPSEVYGRNALVVAAVGTLAALVLFARRA